MDVSFTLENMKNRGHDFKKHTTPVTVWFDSAYGTWGDDQFIGLEEMGSFMADDTACLVVRFHIRETVYTMADLRQPPSPAIAVYVPDRISAPFNQLLKSARFSDVQFELKGSAGVLVSPDKCTTPMPSSYPRYHAHRAVLMGVSPVFEAMFSNGMRETYDSVVEVWDVTARAFERLLEFAYTRQCDLDPLSAPEIGQISADEAVETLLCADQFDVSGLRDICWRNLTARISVESVWDVWAIACELESKPHQRTCKLFCCRNFTQICQDQTSKAVMWAPAHLLKEVLASDSLNVESEELLFETVMRWANFREDLLSSALSPRCRRQPELTRETMTVTGLSEQQLPSPLSSATTTTTKLQPISSFSSSFSFSSSSSSSPSSAPTANIACERKRVLKTLLPCIRFPMMGKEFLLRVVERNSELMGMPVMKDLLIEAYRFHAFNPPKVEKIHQAAKIILPLKQDTDDLTISRSQRRSVRANVQKLFN